MKSPTAFRTISEVSKELGLPQHVLRFWENKFISFCFVHKTGFIHDPFYDRDTNDEKLNKILQKPPLIEGLIWPERFLITLEEE